MYLYSQLTTDVWVDSQEAYLELYLEEMLSRWKGWGFFSLSWGHPGNEWTELCSPAKTKNT